MEIAPAARKAPLPATTAAGPLQTAVLRPEAARAAGSAEAPATPHETRIDIDPATRDVIYRVIDAGTGTVVTQVPAEALLKLGAYVRRLFDGHAAEKRA